MDGHIKWTETRQGWENSNNTTYYGIMAAKSLTFTAIIVHRSSTFILRRPVCKSSSVEFFTWMCECVESCDSQCNHCISTCPLSERQEIERKLCARNWRLSFSKCTITLEIYSKIVAVECAEEDIRSYRWANAVRVFCARNFFHST